MGIQEAFVILLFLAAIGYIGRLFYKKFFSGKKGCDSDCGACSAIDFEAIEKEIAKKSALQVSKDA